MLYCSTSKFVSIVSLDQLFNPITALQIDYINTYLKLCCMPCGRINVGFKVARIKIHGIVYHVHFARGGSQVEDRTSIWQNC